MNFGLSQNHPVAPAESKTARSANAGAQPDLRWIEIGRAHV